MPKELSIDEELEKIILNEIEVEGLFLELKSHFDKSNEEIEHYKQEDEQGKNQYKILVKIINNKPQYIFFHDSEAVQNYFRYICFNEIAGFLNAKGGRLYIGLSDIADSNTGKRDVIGFNLKKDNLDRTKQNLHQYIEGVFRNINISQYIKIDMINYNNNGKYVCVISIKELYHNDWPVLIGTYKDKNNFDCFFTRKDESTIRLSTEKIIKEVQNKERRKDLNLPSVPFDWSEDDFLLLSHSSKIEPSHGTSLLILHDKGWEKDGYFELEPNTTSEKFYLSLTSNWEEIKTSIIKNIGDKVKLSFNMYYKNAVLNKNINDRRVLNISRIGNFNSVMDYEDEIEKIEIIDGLSLRTFWDLNLLKITTKEKILYSLPPINFGGYFICDQSYAQSQPFEDPFEFKSRIEKEIESGALAPPPYNDFRNNLPEPEWFGDQYYKDLHVHKLDRQSICGNIIIFEDLNFISEMFLGRISTDEELKEFDKEMEKLNDEENKFNKKASLKIVH